MARKYERMDNTLNKYEKAAMLFGKEGALGESDAIANYLYFLSALTNNPDSINDTSDILAIMNVRERIHDEINHLLGDVLDAMRIADLKISPDGLDEILDGLRLLSNKKDIYESEKITVDWECAENCGRVQKIEHDSIDL